MMYNIARYDALYGRQSVDKKDSISVESQLDFCKYETHGQPYQTYTDKGFSGKNTNRPDFERMMRDIRAGRIKRVIVYKLDRISRSILDFANMMEVFQEYDVEFVSSTEKFDTSTPIGRAMLNICIVFAQLERETIQKRVTDAYYSRNKKGFFMGGRVPYGFKLEPIVIDGIRTSFYLPIEEEMQQIELIYQLYAEGVKENGEPYSVSDIRNYLLEHNIPQLRGGYWTVSSISSILVNPSYAIADLSLYEFFHSQGANITNPMELWEGGNGCYLYQGTVSKDKSRNSFKDKEVVLAPHVGRVPSYIWIKCRLRCMNSRQMATTNKGKSSWLVGKVKCGNCGKGLQISPSRVSKKTGKSIRYMNCSHKYVTKGLGCSGTGSRIYVDELENYVLKQIKGKLAEFEGLNEQNATQTNPRLNENKIRLAQIDKEIDDLVEKVSGANGVLMRYINEKVEQLDAERRALSEENLSMTVNQSSDTLNMIFNHVSTWEETSFEDKQKVLDAFVKVIKIANGNIEMTWNI